MQDNLGWRFRHEGGRWLVCLQERYEGRRPEVIRLRTSIDAAHASNDAAYETLSEWDPQDHYLTAAKNLYQRIPSLQSTGKLAGQWAAFMLSVLAAPDALLQAQVKGMFEGIVKSFPNARLHLATFETTYNQRMAMVRGLFSGEHTPEVLDRKPFEGFPAASRLIADLQSGLRSYIAPLLLGRMPFVFGVTTSRSNGLLVLNIGQPVEGVEDMGYSGMYQLFVTSNFFSRARLDIGDDDYPDITADEVDSAIRWWIDKLNNFLGVILDPSCFPGPDGIYSPSLHLATHLSLERLASSITDILAYDLTDQFVRKVMFFDALDLLEGMGWGDYKKTLSLERAEALLNKLEEEVPEAVRKLMLDRCHRAVSSLKEVQDAFFVRERIAEGKIRLTSNNGQEQLLGLDKAAAQYLRLIRNSSHSFLKDTQKPFNVSLLASHTGDMPSSISDLPLLYFIDLLVHPEERIRGIRLPRQ